MEIKVSIVPKWVLYGRYIKFIDSAVKLYIQIIRNHFLMQVFFLDCRIIFKSVWMNRQLLYGFAEVCMIVSCYYRAILIGKTNG